MNLTRSAINKKSNKNNNNFNNENLENCEQLIPLAIYCIVLLSGCVLFNSMLCRNYVIAFKEAKYKKKMASTLNPFSFALISLNLVGSVLGFPLVILSNLSCKWLFDEIGCIFTGFIIYFVGCTSIFLIMVMSIERYYATNLDKPKRIFTLSQSILVILTCFTFSFIWCAFPILGWSHYSLEGVKTSCSIEWKSESLNVFSYNIASFLLIFFVPLIFITTTNIGTIIKIKKLNQTILKSMVLSRSKRKRLAYERRVTVVLISIIMTILVCWTPYALVSMYTTFLYDRRAELKPLWSTIPSMFAKSSMMWPSIIMLKSYGSDFRHFNNNAGQSVRTRTSGGSLNI